ncbi:MAG: hypothetical protein ABI537_14030 [Casimicrobiaceae bacterium]
MTTQTMLQQRNSQDGVTEMQVKRLTVPDGLTSLESTKAGRGLPRVMGCLPLLLIAVVAGCASVPSRELSKDSPQEAKNAVLTERINARWSALIKGDLETAYTYLSAASQNAYPFSVYKAKVHPGMWRAVKIDAIGCDGAVCWAKMTLTYDHKSMKGVQTPFSESWVIDKGTTWFVYQPTG